MDRRGPSSQDVLNLIAENYFQAIHPSNLEEFNGFLQYMQKVRQVIFVDVKRGSLIMTVRCTSLRILDELWKDYCTGHLQEVAQRYLVTEDILQQWGLDSVQLKLTISEEEYKAYRKKFLKNEGRYKKKPLVSAVIYTNNELGNALERNLPPLFLAMRITTTRRPHSALAK